MKHARLSPLILAAGIGLSVAAPSRAEIKWDIATGYPDSSFHVKNLRDFAADVSSRTSGTLQITVHAGGSLIKAPDIRQAAIDGKLAMGEVFGPSLSGIHPVFGLDAIPFFSTSYASSRSLWNLSRPLAEKKLADKGLTLLYSVPWPPQGLFSQKQIRQPSDLKGIKLRENSPAVKRVAEVLGAEPVNVETPDLAAAVTSGKVQAVFTSAAQGVDTKMSQTLTWFYPMNAWLPRNAVIMNSKKLAELSPAQREALIRAAASAEERGWALSQENAVDTLKTLKDSGAKIGTIDNAVKSRLDKAATEVVSGMLKGADPELLTVVSKYMTRANSAK
jgi:TRAP-type transport system periplasmic protein